MWGVGSYQFESPPHDRAVTMDLNFRRSQNTTFGRNGRIPSKRFHGRHSFKFGKNVGMFR